MEGVRAHDRAAHRLAQVHAVHHRSRARDDVGVVHALTVAVVCSVVDDEGGIADHGVRPRCVGEDQTEIAPITLKVGPHEDIAARLPRKYTAAPGASDGVGAKGVVPHECRQEGNE